MVKTGLTGITIFLFFIEAILFLGDKYEKI